MATFDVAATLSLLQLRVRDFTKLVTSPVFGITAAEQAAKGKGGMGLDGDRGDDDDDEEGDSGAAPPAAGGLMLRDYQLEVMGYLGTYFLRSGSGGGRAGGGWCSGTTSSTCWVGFGLGFFVTEGRWGGERGCEGGGGGRRLMVRHYDGETTVIRTKCA